MKTTATISKIYISDGHKYYGRHGKDSLDKPIVEKESVELVAGQGIVGDRFYGYKEDYKGQITFFDVSVWRDLEGILGTELEPSRFRRNVLIEGLDLNSLIGRTFDIDGVRYEGVEECKPCYWMDEAHAPGAEEALKGRGGLRCRILDDGDISVGEVEVREVG